MMFHASKLFAAGLCVAAVAAAPIATAQEKVVNVYSARHYKTDESLYSNFTKATGIRINRVDADDAGILARLQSEGAASPADVILLVDAARLWSGEVNGLFQPLRSNLLEFPRNCAARTAAAVRSGSGFRPAPGSSSITRRA